MKNKRKFKIDIYVWVDKWVEVENDVCSKHIYTEDIQTLYLTFDEIKHHFRTGLHGFEPKTSKQAIKHLNIKNWQDAEACNQERRVQIAIH